MTLKHGFLKSQVGRRLVLLFVIAAFLPIAVMMVIAFTRVDAALEQALQSELTQAAKSYGLQLLDRLVRIDGLLDDATLLIKGDSLPERLPERVAAEFAGIAIVSTEGRTLSHVGSLPDGWHLDPALVAALGRGKTVLIPTNDAPSQLLLLRRFVTTTGATRIVAAAVRLNDFWGDAKSYPAMTDFCIGTAGAVVLHCSRPISAQQVSWPQLGQGGASSLAWSEGDDRFRASAWPLFLESHFVSGDWIVLAMQPERYALRASNSFRTAFIPVALLAVLIVVFVSTNQIRRTLVPLQKLLAGTLQVTRSDFNARIDVAGGDEFGQLASAFNEMAARVGLNFRTLSAFADIDRAILTNLDLAGISATAMRCLQELAAVDLVSIALIEPGAQSGLRVFTLCARDRDGSAHREFEWDPDAMASITPSTWSASPPLPLPYVSHLRECGARQFALLPVARGASASGVVVLGHATAIPIAAENTELIAGVVDRLAIALAAAARDKKLYEQAHFDNLTGLPNRYYLQSLLAQSLARAQREQHRVAVLFVDLDNFKRTNDTLGHAAGDRLLQAAADRIRAVVRAGDVVARLGGDEFTVVLEASDEVQIATAVAKKLIAVLSERFEVDGQSMYLGASIGIAVFPSDCASADDLLKQADTAMYRAKSKGRGRYAFFEERMNIEASERARVDRELRQALLREEFVLHYQPQLDLRSGRLSGAEALVRWQHPQRGLLGPASFIAVAEESGLIDAIGGWVLDHACQQLAQWRAQGLNVEHMSVNVSSRQLQQPDFFGSVMRALEANEVPAAALVLEVTESLLTDSASVQVLRRLQENGVLIAVDDFGTGYSSFAYLHTLPISILKIDRAFIVDIATSVSAGTIAAAIINMAHALGKQAVAEGVESEEQIAFLEEAGCDQMQGFVVSRPLDAAAFPAFMRGYRRQARVGSLRPMPREASSLEHLV